MFSQFTVAFRNRRVNTFRLRCNGIVTLRRTADAAQELEQPSTRRPWVSQLSWVLRLAQENRSRQPRRLTVTLTLGGVIPSS